MIETGKFTMKEAKNKNKLRLFSVRMSTAILKSDKFDQVLESQRSPETFEIEMGRKINGTGAASREREGKF